MTETMSANPLLGSLIFALGGLAGAVFALPFRKVKGWAYESYWLIYAVFGLVLFPAALACATVPDLGAVIAKTPGPVLLGCAGFGALWGIGGLTWGLMIRYLGVGLGLAIGCGLCSATGTLLPPLFKGAAGELVKDKAALVTLGGVALSLLGIVFVGLAGKAKEGELPEELKKKAVAEFNFKKGMLVACISGVFSGCINFGLQNGWWKTAEGAVVSMADLAKQAGAGDWWTGMPVLVVVLWGGFAVNAAWCLWTNGRNRTFGDYAKAASPAGAGVIFWAGLAGVIWACQFACLKMGEPLCGDMAYVGFAILMGASVLFSSLLGVFLGEWKGTGAKTRSFLGLGLGLLALSIVVTALAKNVS